MQGELLLVASQEANLDAQDRPDFTPAGWWVWMLVALALVAVIAWFLKRSRLGGGGGGPGP